MCIVAASPVRLLSRSAQPTTWLYCKRKLSIHLHTRNSEKRSDSWWPNDQQPKSQRALNVLLPSTCRILLFYTDVGPRYSPSELLYNYVLAKQRHKFACACIVCIYLYYFYSQVQLATTVQNNQSGTEKLSLLHWFVFVHLTFLSYSTRLKFNDFKHVHFFLKF